MCRCRRGTCFSCIGDVCSPTCGPRTSFPRRQAARRLAPRIGPPVPTGSRGIQNVASHRDATVGSVSGSGRFRRRTRRVGKAPGRDVGGALRAGRPALCRRLDPLSAGLGVGRHQQRGRVRRSPRPNRRQVAREDDVSDLKRGVGSDAGRAGYERRGDAMQRFVLPPRALPQREDALVPGGCSVKTSLNRDWEVGER